MNSAIDAIDAVDAVQKGYRAAANTFCVPKTTLIRRIGNKNKTITEKQYVYGRNPLL